MLKPRTLVIDSLVIRMNTRVTVSRRTSDEEQGSKDHQRMVVVTGIHDRSEFEIVSYVLEVAILAVSTVILTLTDYVGDPINVSIITSLICTL